MKKPILAFTALALCSTAAVADSERELAEEMLELTHVEDMVTETIAAYSEQLAMQDPQMDAGELEGMLEEAMGWDEIREPVIDMVVDLYDEDELEGINEFYRSDVGQVYSEKAPEFSGQLSQLIVTNIQQALGAGQQQQPGGAPGGGGGGAPGGGGGGAPEGGGGAPEGGGGPMP